MKNLIYTIPLIFLFLVSCSTKQYTPQQRQAETLKLNTMLDSIFDENVKRYPTWQTYLGLKTNYDKLNNQTEAYQIESLEIAKNNLKNIKNKINFDALDKEGKLSYRLFVYEIEKEIEGWKWRHHYYPLNQMFGYHSGVPSFLINMHRINNKKEAKDYIARVKEIKRVFDERMVFNKKQKDMGIIPPKFVFAKVISDAKNIIKGAPFSKSQKDSPLLEDFKKKVKKINLSKKDQRMLVGELNKVLISHLKPSYENLVSYMTELQALQKQSHGAWSLPDGKEYYRWRLKNLTTTDMTADEIHEFGLQEVDRIHGEMKHIMKKVGFKGSLSEFFLHMKSDKYLYPDTKKGRRDYLSSANKIIADMKTALPKMFKTFPKAELEVKAVESYREKTAGIAFYQGPSLYGDRPGIYYVNLYKMADNPKYKMEALAYHEALPGHHMQIAIKTELKDLPKFRRTGGYTAYSEGWGLYSEKLPKEYGFYQDPYSDFGRLSMELWRAARLVTDTGLHAKKWTREQGINYLKKNTPNADLEIEKGIERYIVMPGQATTYKIGMTKILELREKAKSKLKEQFDIRDFHDVVLRSGALPLNILEEQVDKWLE